MSPSFKSVATTGSENYVLHCVKLKSEYISAIWSVLNALVLFACSSAVRVTRSIVLYACFVDLCLSFVIFLLAIVLSVLLRFTDSHYSFGIFKLFTVSRENITHGLFTL